MDLKTVSLYKTTSKTIVEAVYPRTLRLYHRAALTPEVWWNAALAERHPAAIYITRGGVAEGRGGTRQRWPFCARSSGAVIAILDGVGVNWYLERIPLSLTRIRRL
jgi:hypothetical protein